MKQKNLLPILMTIIVLSPLGIDTFLPAMLDMSVSLDTSMDNIQMCIALYLFASGFGQLFAGPLSDKYGRLPLIKGGLCLYLVGAALSALATDISLLWFSRVLHGFGACAITVSVFSITRDHYGPDKSPRILSYLFGAIYVIPAVAPLIGGVLLQRWGWESNFVFMVIYGLLVTIVALVSLQESRPENSVIPTKLISFSNYKPIFANADFIFHSTLAMLAMAIIIHYLGLAPEKLMNEQGLSPTDFALWFGVNAIFSIVGAFLAPTIIDKVGNDKALYTGGFLNFIALVLLIQLKDYNYPLAFMAPIFISSIGLCLIFAVSCGAALAPFGERAGIASSMLGLMQMSGSSILVSLICLLPISNINQFVFTITLSFTWISLGRLLISKKRCRAIIDAQHE